MSRYFLNLKTIFLGLISAVTALVVVLSGTAANGVISGSSDSEGKAFQSGQVANPNPYPWMVALLSTDEADPYLAQFCGGSLIAVDLVITAAHCVDTLEELSEVKVVVGVLDLNGIQDSDKQSVSRIIIHKDWNFDTTKNDIAILRLSDRTRNIGVPLIKLQNKQSAVLEGDLLKVLGWGESAPDVFPTSLQEGDVSAGSSPYSARCQKWQTKDYDRKTMLCASGFNSPNDIVDTCFGDSGGPLLRLNEATPELVGITSWGADECPKTGFPGLYTRISSYLDWVDNKISPKIISVGPKLAEAGTSLKIRGTNFFIDEIISISIAGIKTSFEVLSPKLIRAEVPAGADAGFVSIRTKNDKILSPKRYQVG